MIHLVEYPGPENSKFHHGHKGSFSLKFDWIFLKAACGNNSPVQLVSTLTPPTTDLIKKTKLEAHHYLILSLKLIFYEWKSHKLIKWYRCFYHSMRFDYNLSSYGRVRILLSRDFQFFFMTMFLVYKISSIYKSYWIHELRQ